MTKERDKLEQLKQKPFACNSAEIKAALEEAFRLGFEEGHKTVTTDDWIHDFG